MDLTQLLLEAAQAEDDEHRTPSDAHSSAEASHSDEEIYRRVTARLFALNGFAGAAVVEDQEGGAERARALGSYRGRESAETAAALWNAMPARPRLGAPCSETDFESMTTIVRTTGFVYYLQRTPRGLLFLAIHREDCNVVLVWKEVVAVAQLLGNSQISDRSNDP